MKKYRKVKQYMSMEYDDLKDAIKKKAQYLEFMAWITIDLNTNEIKIEQLTNKVFKKALGSIKKRNKLYRAYIITKNYIENFIVDKLHITRSPSRKDLQTLFIKNTAIMMVTDPKSHTHIEAKATASILQGIISSKGIFGHMHIMDNLNIEDRPTNFLELTGRLEESRKIWNIWMNSKYDEKARVKLHKALDRCLFKQLTIKK